MLLRHLWRHFGYCIIVLQSKIHMLLKDKYVELINDKINIYKRTINYYFKEVYTIVLQELFNNKKFELVISGNKD